MLLLLACCSSSQRAENAFEWFRSGFDEEESHGIKKGERSQTRLSLALSPGLMLASTRLFSHNPPPSVRPKKKPRAAPSAPLGHTHTHTLASQHLSFLPNGLCQSTEWKGPPRQSTWSCQLEERHPPRNVVVVVAPNNARRLGQLWPLSPPSASRLPLRSQPQRVVVGAGNVGAASDGFWGRALQGVVWPHGVDTLCHRSGCDRSMDRVAGGEEEGRKMRPPGGGHEEERRQASAQAAARSIDQSLID
jgi:hypothetical protein